MKIKYITNIITIAATFFSFCCFLIMAGKAYAQENKSDMMVTLEYQDTLTLPSLIEFDLLVKMKPASEISAISLGFYFPVEYLEITGMKMGGGAIGSHYTINDSLFRVVWSNINPVTIEEGDTLMVLKMKSLDLSLLEGTIRLGLYEFTEFADAQANVIEDVVLEIPEINYLEPNPQDTIAGTSVRVFPNPFDDFTIVDFTLKIESKVKLSLFNPEGQEISTWDKTSYPKGNHQVRLYGSDYAKGIYVLKFEIQNSEGEGMKTFKIMNNK